MTGFGFNRRDMFKSLLAISAIGAATACGSGQEAGTDADAPAEPVEGKQGFLTIEEMALITAIAGTIVPKTDTAGAVEAGVPETIQALATDWANDQFKQFWRNGLGLLDMALKGDTELSFVELSSEERLAVLTAYDAKVFDGDVQDQFYRALKGTVLTAYYMSEPGATEELAYEPVPGDWIGCVPLSEYPKTWAT